MQLTAKFSVITRKAGQLFHQLLEWLDAAVMEENLYFSAEDVLMLAPPE